MSAEKHPFSVEESYEEPWIIILKINTCGKKLSANYQTEIMKVISDNITEENFIIPPKNTP